MARRPKQADAAIMAFDLRIASLVVGVLCGTVVIGVASAGWLIGWLSVH